MHPKHQSCCCWMFKRDNRKANHKVVNRNPVICNGRKRENNRNTGDRRCFPSSSCFRVSKKCETPPMKLLKRLRDKLITALCQICMRRRPSPRITSSSEKQKPSLSTSTIDSQRTKAIEDCIDYINSSVSSTSIQPSSCSSSRSDT